jgi:DNA-binding transcriptional ArsR family regulator
MNDLAQTFFALSDPTRLTVLRQLLEGGDASVGELAAPHDMTLAAFMKHLRVLEDVSLLRREKIGRTVWCRIDIAPLHKVSAWATNYQKFWAAQLESFASFVEAGP